MAINDIQLTTGMRQNLQSLQATTTLLSRTQARLATGKKVNSALDDPTAFFAAAALDSRATNIDSLKSAMGQGIDTITAADKGITGVTSLLDQARGLAQQVQSVAASDTGQIATLSTAYGNVLSQIDNMASDSGYQGINLLSASGSLTVNFETGSLVVAGFDASHNTGLGITQESFTAPTDGAAAVTQIQAALTTLQGNSDAMSANLSIITARQNFSTDMVNTLTDGSGKLTLADTNEEGANMLMLQTRQSLSTTALSLASQAAQSVLKLFG